MHNTAGEFNDKRLDSSDNLFLMLCALNNIQSARTEGTGRDGSGGSAVGSSQIMSPSTRTDSTQSSADTSWRQFDPETPAATAPPDNEIPPLTAAETVQFGINLFADGSS